MLFVFLIFTEEWVIHKLASRTNIISRIFFPRFRDPGTRPLKSVSILLFGRASLNSRI
jgi:hypothetical protein